MKKNRYIKLFWFLGVLVSISSCVEELDIENVANENGGMLVVEATFTDNLETQQVFLTRSVARLDIETDTTYFRFRPLGLGLQDSVEYEENARVVLIGSDGNNFDFFEEQQGVYSSTQSFALQQGVEYRLQISTSSNIDYESDAISLPATSRLANLYAERITTDLGEEGIQIFADSEPIGSGSPNYRYTYDETYKIVAPFWREEDYVLTNYDPCALPVPTYDLEILPREVQNQICYSTVKSNTVIQSEVQTSGNSVQRFPVRFIPKDNYVTAHRYSILVRQLVQNSASFDFYNALKEFSENDNLFSQVQPGPLAANVTRSDGTQETVLGYVDASTVSEQRIYIEFNDFFPGEPLPDYPFPCTLESAPESHVSYCFTGLNANSCPPSVIERVNDGLINYVGENIDNIGVCPGIDVFVARVCGDCTLIGQNTPPDFWEE
ncbi:DUF4249 domain-containing protein [Croceivirga thetidis]|uniref:DUF4249 domain-containing protein n=1 Tax=Croceivirga thetidis TaxID=2721623 RepID=A0ABX1GUP5_9FLAO|nr:DUF4249 domain-containing protein [Croceivirga thetidis]NKI32472.1 DUF4249 domain-containing protein [Croceivirga thetidis]